MRHGFVLKGGVVVALVSLFDCLFRHDFAGACIGGFAGAWLAGLLIARPDVRRSRLAWPAIALAGGLALALAWEPGPLGWAMFWCALSVAALLPRATRFDDAWRWGARLVLHAIGGIIKPVADCRRLWLRQRGRWRRPHAVVATLALPVIGAGVFALLFTAANPLIEQALTSLRLPSPGRLPLWIFVALCLWPSLRPHAAVMGLARWLPDPEPRLPGTSLPSVLIALALFNALFAVQNGLDIAFLWSGAPLPSGMTQAEYAHRGAYPLIAVALIAGLMALAMLRPGSASEHHPWARRLVLLWVAQTVILVASSTLRTLDYIATSMWTAWRIAALLWMALVALGLVLIGWRILRARSARWLINANALAATVVLAACTVVDLGAIAAARNVWAGTPQSVDLCYLHRVGDGALGPLIALEGRPMDAGTRDRVRFVRQDLLTDLAARQSDWRRWTPRGALRLSDARARLGPVPARPVPVAEPAWRACDGTIQYPPVPATRP